MQNPNEKTYTIKLTGDELLDVFQALNSSISMWEKSTKDQNEYRRQAAESFVKYYKDVKEKIAKQMY